MNKVLGSVCILFVSVGSAAERYSVDGALGGSDFLHGRELAVTGRLFLGYENNVLAGQTGRVWVDFFGRHGRDRDAWKAAIETSRPMRELALSLVGRCVTVTATFNADRVPYGGELFDIRSMEAADERHCIGIPERQGLFR